MSIELSWIIEGKVILHRNVGDVTLHDLLTVDEPLNAMLNRGSGAEAVHMVVLANPDGNGPMSVRAFTAATWPRNPNLSWTVVVGLKHPVLRFAADTASQILGMKARFFKTPEGAARYLLVMDTTLPRDFSHAMWTDDSGDANSASL
ncbi:MAG: hypothetical protein AAF787_04950 [Chloroflexota bacterium]